MRYSSYRAGFFLAVPILLTVMACRGITEADLSHLSGYWEIREAVAADGSSRTYGAAPAVDYYQLENLKGYRKKVQPQADGSFLASDDALPVEIASRDGKFYLRFGSGADRWEEELLQLTANELQTRNPEGIRYTYTRYEPLNLATDGTKR